MSSHEVLTCTCATKLLCPIPGHVGVPITVEPAKLVEAGREALHHLDAAIQSVLAARAAWVSRGLPGDNPLPLSLDRLAATMTANWSELRRWVSAADEVARRHAS